MLEVAMHFASGNSLVSGLAMLFIAYGLLSRRTTHGRWALLALRLLIFLGVAFVVLATVPFSAFVWAAFGLTVLPLLIRSVSPQRESKSCRSFRLAWATFTAMALGMLWSEFAPSASLPASAANRSIVVIGDSLSADETDPKLTAWPALLSDHGWVVSNKAQMGATAASALRQTQNLEASDAVVLIAIGGNDLLGPTTPEKFEESLEALVRSVSTPGREIVLFELPLPPFKFEWGAIQRRVARKHGCHLVTRRIIAAVLGGPGNTVDGIHLSQRGHTEMARLVQERVLPPRDLSLESAVGGSK
jgi:acyl-CoA thioesterase I